MGVSMRAKFELDIGEAKLREIMRALPPESPYWNESENRFQFVDRLLLECLGWDHPYIRVEVADGAGGKADYVMGNPARAILEAKREAKWFGNLPTGKPSVVRKLAPLLKSSKDLEDAVHQVIGYCSLKGAQLAIICNGPQLVIFQALIPGASPLEGECFFFNGLESYLENFPLLWTLLSPEGVSENRAYREIAVHRNPRIPEKASVAIAEPLRYRYRSPFQENIRELSSLLLEEIEDNPELREAFYNDCYVPIEANNRHLLLSKQIIASRYRRASGDNIAPTGLDGVTKISGKNQIQFDGAAALTGALSRPIVVLGDVGVGKTSFFEKLLLSIEKSVEAETYFLHINLGVKANLASDLRGFMLQEIPRMLKEKYDLDIDAANFVEAIYYEELRSFDKSTRGELKEVDPVAYAKERISFLVNLQANRDRHLLASFGHIVRGRKKQIILVMDNADQRNYATQQEAFLIAQELAATRNMLVFVSLRPSTFYESKSRGALAAYQNKVFTISPPPADEVIQRRLTFALRVAEGQKTPASLQGVRLNLKSIAAFLRATLRSIKANEAIQQFLSNISGGNTRSVLELVTTFFGSPNVDSSKIVSIELDTGKYKVPLHEFTKHALLGEYSYFNQNSSLYATNVFDVSSSDAREHFLPLLVISYLTSNLGSKDHDGFVLGEQVIGEMLKQGFVEDQTRAALKRLATRRLIETPYAHYRELEVSPNTLPDEYHYRATSIGVYHARFWVGSFAFLDATSTDTPIFEPSAREAIFHLAGSFDIKDRYTKTTQFRDYLETQWHLANLSPNYYDFPAVLRSQQDGFDIIEAIVKQAPKPQQKRPASPFNYRS